MRDYDIESDLKQEKFQHLKLVQGDRGNKIKINVYEDGQPVNLAGCSVTAKYKRADGKVVDGTVENKTDNYFYAVMDNNITKVAGTLKMLFNIENGDVKVSTFLLLADVREGIGENTGSSGGDTEVTVDLNDYQKKTDNGLETKNKYIVGAINEVNSQCKDIAKQVENVGQPTQQQINTAIDKAIEEGRLTGSGGINSTAKTLLETILKNAIYTTDQSANITALMSTGMEGNLIDFNASGLNDENTSHTMPDSAQTNSEHHVTPYIPVDTTQTYYTNLTSKVDAEGTISEWNQKIYFYNSEKQYITVRKYDLNKLPTVKIKVDFPENTAYVRVYFHTGYTAIKPYFGLDSNNITV